MPSPPAQPLSAQPAKSAAAAAVAAQPAVMMKFSQPPSSPSAGAAAGGGGAAAGAAAGGGAQELAGVSKSLDQNLEVCRVFACVAHELDEGAQRATTPLRFFARASTVQSYLEANQLVAVLQGAASAAASTDKTSSTAAAGGGQSVKGAGKSSRVPATMWGFQVEGVILPVEKMSVVAPSVTFLDKRAQQTARRAVLGPSAVIGEASKLNDCVVMEGATIGANVIIQGSIVCSGAVIGDGTSLKNCQVARGFHVPAKTKGVDESFNDGPGETFGDHGADDEDDAAGSEILGMAANEGF